MKKAISLILIICTILMCTIQSGFAMTNTISVPLYIWDTFDYDPQGSFPAYYRKPDSFGNISVEEYSAGDNKGLKYNITSTANASIDRLVSKLAGDIIIEFDLCFENKSGGALIYAYKNYAGDGEANLFSIDLAKQQIKTPSGELVYTFTAGEHFSLCMSLSLNSGKAVLYVNDGETSKDFTIDNSSACDFALLRTYIRNTSSDKLPVFYFDNFRIYSGDMPIFKYESAGYKVNSYLDSSRDYISADNVVWQYLKNAAVMYLGKPYVYKNTYLLRLDAENPAAAPIMKDGEVFIPHNALEACFGAQLIFDVADRLVSATYGDNTLNIKAGDSTAVLNNSPVDLGIAPYIDRGILYIPLEGAAECFGKKVSLDKSGMIFVDTTQRFPDIHTELGIFRNLASKLVFDIPKGAELVDIINSRYIGDKSHPRLFANSDDIESLKSEIITDANKSVWYENAIKAANSYLISPLCEYVVEDNIRLLTDDAVNILTSLSFAYQMTGRSEYASRCIEQLLKICSWKDWNEYHFLDTAAIMAAVARAYDWVYSEISAADRETIKNALIEKGLNHALADYDNTERSRSYNWAQSDAPDNWNMVCNTGTLLAALVIADEEAELCSKIFDKGFSLIQRAILMYAPDGAWYEGTGYWNYTTRHYTLLMSAMESVFGSHYGYMDLPGVRETSYFAAALNGMDGSFNFHDASEGLIEESSFFYFADVFGDSTLNDARLNQINNEGFHASINDIIWYNPKLTGGTERINNNAYFRDAEIAVMKTGADEGNNVFASIHAGRVDVYHGHYDVGQFVIEGFGTRYACDMGIESYSLTDKRDELYRIRAEGHNTLVINPDMGAGQSLSGDTKINRFEFNDNGALSVIDMTSAYPEVRSAKRAMKVNNELKTVILQDEIKTAAPIDIWWFMHTKREIEIGSDGRAALIKGDTKDMLVSLVGDVAAKFTKEKAEPMLSSPVVEGQNANEGYSKLSLNIKADRDITIPIVFEFVDHGEKDGTYVYEISDIDTWQIDSPQSFSYSDISYSKPKLESGLIEAGVRVENAVSFTGKKEVAALVLALYDGKGEMKDISVAKLYNEQGLYSVSLNVPGGEGYKLKAMLIDKNLTPLCVSKTLE